jgi:hypothetical protein
MSNLQLQARSEEPASVENHIEMLIRSGDNPNQLAELATNTKGGTDDEPRQWRMAVPNQDHPTCNCVDPQAIGQ